MSIQSCCMEVKINKRKLIDSLGEVLTLKISKGKPTNPDETLQVTQHILDCFIEALEEFKEDMHACAALSKKFDVPCEWGDDAKEKIINEFVEKAELSADQKEKALELLKFLMN